MKYMGSKARLAFDILPVVTAERQPGQWYVEPFVGGCNVIDKVVGNRLGSDINPYLIAMLKALQHGWVPPYITANQYRDIQRKPDSYPSSLVGWAGINCSYNGKWFGGYAGKVNTSIGTVRDYQEEARRNVLAQITNLPQEEVLFVHATYRNLGIPEESIIYCDPPYANTTRYSTQFNSERFWQWVRDMSREGHTVYVSEYTAPEDFECVWQLVVTSSLSGINKFSRERLFKWKLA